MKTTKIVAFLFFINMFIYSPTSHLNVYGFVSVDRPSYEDMFPEEETLMLVKLMSRRGKRYYKRACSRCHGVKGKLDRYSEEGVDFKTSVIVSDPLRIPTELIRTVLSGNENGMIRMDKYSDKELAAILTFMRYKLSKSKIKEPVLPEYIKKYRDELSINILPLPGRKRVKKHKN